MIKKLTGLVLLLALALSLVACGGYEAIPSTEEEARVMMTFSYDGEKYEMRYELYRTMFLTYKSLIDDGDGSVWLGENKQEYIDRIDEIIISRVADIFATIHIAKKIGRDPYSAEADERVQELIKISVEGSSTEEGTIEGFGGDYDAYLASLKKYYMNYSVSELILRYSIAYNDIIDYYKGNFLEGELDEEIKVGNLEFQEKNIQDFYNGDGSARVLLATLDERSFSRERAEEIRDKIASFANETSVQNYIITMSATTAEDAIDGVLIGKYSLEEAYFSEVTEAAFSLSEGETSAVIPVTTESGSYYYILYRTDKPESFYEENKADVYSVFADNEIGKIINEAKSGIIAAADEEALFGQLDRASVTMD